jgi:RluA family pseudouridine synthase
MDQPPMIQILYSDEALLVVNKPAGLSTLPDGYHPAQPHVKSLLEAQFGRLWTVHRLDKDTSGVLLFARTAGAHRSLNTQFEARQVSKVYHALVMGSPAWTEYTVDLPLRPNGDRQHRTVVDMGAGKPAVTHFKLLEYLGNACLLEAIPETGRTHQIRAHLFTLDLYILGDPLYSLPKGVPETSLSPVQGESVSQLQGMALHARQLELVHPISAKRMKFEAASPPGWLNLLDSLRM